MKPPDADKQKGPDAATSKPQCNHVEATAQVSYRNITPADKRNMAGGVPEKAAQRHDGYRTPRTGEVAFRGPEGVVWRYSGKRGRVLYLLATMSQGVTQWDTLPWHTRLGGSIHAMRADGLAIETVPEGEWRHARYFLRTAGSLLIQAKNRETGNGRRIPVRA